MVRLGEGSWFDCDSLTGLIFGFEPRPRTFLSVLVLPGHQMTIINVNLLCVVSEGPRRRPLSPSPTVLVEPSASRHSNQQRFSEN